METPDAGNLYPTLPDQVSMTQSISEKDLFEIKLEQAPEKKGLFIKHVEYEVASEGNRVPRRYNDFVVLHEILMQYYPTRLLPRLPPKKVIGATDQIFIAQRKKALGRYLTILSRHQVIRKSQFFQYFLAYAGDDFQSNVKDRFKTETDEFFMTSAAEYDHIRTPEWAMRLAQLKEHVIGMENGIQKLRKTMEMVAASTKDEVRNYMALNLDVSNLCTLGTSPFMDFSSGTPGINQQYTNVLSDVGSEIASVTKQWLELADTEESTLEYAYLLKDLMKGWKDLLLRQNKYSTMDQKALSKPSAITKAKSSDEKAEKKNEEKTISVINAENRVKFSLHCLQQEMVFIESILPPVMTLFMRTLAATERSHLNKIALAWNDVAQITEFLPMSSRAVPSAPG